LEEAAAKGPHLRSGPVVDTSRSPPDFILTPSLTPESPAPPDTVRASCALCDWTTTGSPRRVCAEQARHRREAHGFVTEQELRKQARVKQLEPLLRELPGTSAEVAARLERLSKCVLRVEELEADQAAADREECFVDVVSAFVADAQASVLVQPGDRALDDPALLAESGAVRCFGGGDPRLDAAAAELAPSFARVVGAVAIEPFRAMPWPAAAAAHRRDRVDERDHLRDVVAVAARQSDRERAAAPAGDQVVLGAAS
jgi:hypothetical protein